MTPTPEATCGGADCGTGSALPGLHLKRCQGDGGIDSVRNSSGSTRDGQLPLGQLTPWSYLGRTGGETWQRPLIYQYFWPSLNQRVQGSSPCAPTSKIKGLD